MVSRELQQAIERLSEADRAELLAYLQSLPVSTTPAGAAPLPWTALEGVLSSERQPDAQQRVTRARRAADRGRARQIQRPR